MKKTLLFALSMLLLSGLYSQTPLRSYIDDPGLPRHEHVLDFRRLTLELWPDGPAGTVRGRVTHYFRCLRPSVDKFFLDGIQMEVKSMTLNGKPVKFETDSAGITVYPQPALAWDQDDSLSIEYTARPRRGLYFIGWNDARGLSRKQIWSQGEGVDNRYWIPLYDEPNDKLLTELTVHFDTAYKVLSNGRLVEHGIDGAGLGVWHYALSHPQAPYLIMLGIGKYEVKETHSASGVPLHLYYYPEWKDRVEPTYIHSAAMVDFFEKETGIPYPWESYSQLPVQDYMFGAMENTTATVFGDFYMADARGALDRSYIAVNAHELAHQWFGDYVTARSEASIWLQESFATYYNQLFEREVLGQDHFEWEQCGAGNAALEDSKHNVLGVAHSESGGNRVYGKGAYVLDMLKYVVGGREAYNKAIEHYLRQHPYTNVDTHELMLAFEESTGMSLQWFWDEWLFRGGEPDFHIKVVDQPESIEWVIMQHLLTGGVTGFKDGVFKMPVVLEAHCTDGSVISQTVDVDAQTQVVRMIKPEGKKLAYALFDPGSHILKTINFPKTPDALLLQAADAKSMIDRYDALVALRAVPMDKKRDGLISAFHKEGFFYTRSEALTQLTTDSSAAARKVWREALADKDVAVRKAALAAVDPYGPAVGDLLPALEKMLTDSSYDIIDQALQRLADARPAELKRWLGECRGVTGVLARNVEVRWNELAWQAWKDVRYADRLVDICSGSYEFRTRVNAMNALRRMDYFNPTLLTNLVDAIFNPNTRLSGPAMDVLSYFFAQDRNHGMIARYVRAGRWEPWQQGLMRGFLK